MKKNYFYFVALIAIALFLNACEQGEPKNMEADLLSIKLYGGENHDQLITEKNNIQSDQIKLFLPELKSYTDIMAVMEISEGATVNPPSGGIYDFTDGMTFRVTSEDKQWNRVYNVIIDSTSNWIFGFEKWNTISSGNVTYQEPEGWTSANKGVQMLIRVLGIDFPTYRTEDAFSGDYALEMATRKGVDNGGFIPPLISGSAFLGNFNTDYMMTDNLLCAEFGVPFDYNGVTKPSKLKVAVKYIPGEIYTDENSNVVPDKQDAFSLYAVLFWGDEPLTARDMATSERIIAKAIVDNTLDYSEYRLVEVNFDYDNYGGVIPTDKTIQLSVVAGSSVEGDYYRGAVGSTLTIDNVEVVF